MVNRTFLLNDFQLVALGQKNVFFFLLSVIHSVQGIGFQKIYLISYTFENDLLTFSEANIFL